MANLNTDLIRDELLEILAKCTRRGLLTEVEYDNLTDDFEYYFRLMINQVEERKVEPKNIDWNKPGAFYQDEYVTIH